MRGWPGPVAARSDSQRCVSPRPWRPRYAGVAKRRITARLLAASPTDLTRAIGVEREPLAAGVRSRGNCLLRGALPLAWLC